MELDSRKNLTPSPSPKERGVKKQKKRNCGGNKSYFLASVILRSAATKELHRPAPLPENFFYLQDAK